MNIGGVLREGEQSLSATLLEDLERCEIVNKV